MSTSSPRILRNGKILFQSSSDTVIRSSSINLSPNMESTTYLLDEQIQSGRNSLANRMSSQQVNEERMNHLQNEMSKPKAMMERPIEQNEERNKQTDGSADSATKPSTFGKRLPSDHHTARRPTTIQKGVCKRRYERSRPIQMEWSQIRPGHSDIRRFSKRFQDDWQTRPTNALGCFFSENYPWTSSKNWRWLIKKTLALKKSKPTYSANISTKMYYNI